MTKKRKQKNRYYFLFIQYNILTRVSCSVRLGDEIFFWYGYKNVLREIIIYCSYINIDQIKIVFYSD